MTYLNAIKYLKSLSQDNSLLNDPAIPERMRLVCNHFGFTAGSLKSLHICGDVGKDSCCLMLSSILQNAAYKVGRYSLPSSDDFKSCISLNEKKISHTDFAEIITSIYRFYKAHLKDTVPHRNEILALAAVYYFQKEKCDMAIFEKNHSRYDPVNITGAPIVSLITPFFERQADSNLFENIIHKGTTETVSSPQHKEIYNAISGACSLAGSRLTVPIYSEMEIEKITLFKTFFKYRRNDYSVKSFSPCQTVNAITAIEAANSLNRVGANISDVAIAKGISSTYLDGKCETISLNPTIILSSSCEKDRLDTILASLAQIKEYLPDKISFYIDSKSNINIPELSSLLSARNLPHDEIAETDQTDDIVKGLIPMQSDQPVDENAAVFIGSKCFISNTKNLILKYFGT